MLAAVFSFTKRGMELGKQVASFLNEVGYATSLWTMPKYAEQEIAAEVVVEGDFCAAAEATGTDDYKSLGYSCDYHEVVKQAMWECQALVFVGATGICIRAIAPNLRDKTVDPAIISLDERANFVIPLIAGHIGGANELARHLAEAVGATPCVTTATDVNGLFAVDEWAARNKLTIGSMKAAKAVATALVNCENVGVVKDDNIAIAGALPKQVVLGEEPAVGMAISVYDNVLPYETTLQLFPKIVHLGVGCRRNTPLENIEALVLMALENLHLDMRSVVGLASVDLKKDEQGLLAFARKYKIQANFYTAEELNAVEGDFTPSAFVKSIVGVSNVCERSAVKDSEGGELILRKTSLNGVTVAVAVKPLTLDFNKTGLRK